MPADDHPFDALKKQFEMEDLSVSPVLKVVLGVASLVPLPPPFDKAIRKLQGHLAADSLDKVYLLFEAIANEVRKHDTCIRELRDDEALRGLFFDAVRKATNTRAKERIKRIGVILANASVELEQTDADETEEMMRVATELSDNDIKYLRELVKIEGHLLQAQDHIPRYDAHGKWEQGFWGDRIIPEIDSAFSKLESYGLVARLAPSNTPNIMADFQNRYVLLKKGLRFVQLIREASASNT